MRVAGGGWLNLVLYKCEPDILRKILAANRVADFLAGQGLPVRRTHDQRILQMKSGNFVKFAALYNYLPGRTIPWEAYTKRHIKNLGAMLGAMHQALQRLPRLGEGVADEYLGILARMERYFADPNVQSALRQKLALAAPQDFSRQRRLLHLCQKLPGQHMLHMDFVRSNILFDEGGGIAGIIDFEKTAWGHPLFDIARTLAFLLVDCKYKTESQVRQYFLISGYARRNHQTFKNLVIHSDGGRIDILEELVNLLLLYDFYKFLRHNPYESLLYNEHFVRTRTALIARHQLCDASPDDSSAKIEHQNKGYQRP